jgi:hypothetical protein
MLRHEQHMLVFVKIDLVNQVASINCIISGDAQVNVTFNLLVVAETNVKTLLLQFITRDNPSRVKVTHNASKI